MDFRACLVSLGKELYYRILADPEHLADIADRPDIPFMQAEGFQYVAATVFEEKTGREMPGPEGLDHPAEPQGESFDFDNEAEMKTRVPVNFRRVLSAQDEHPP